MRLSRLLPLHMSWSQPMVHEIGMECCHVMRCQIADCFVSGCDLNGVSYVKSVMMICLVSDCCDDLDGSFCDDQLTHVESPNRLGTDRDSDLSQRQSHAL